jgi:hypothetical protein
VALVTAANTSGPTIPLSTRKKRGMLNTAHQTATLANEARLAAAASASPRHSGCRRTKDRAHVDGSRTVMTGEDA